MNTSDALRECRQILKESGSSFALAFRVLPAEQRDAMTAFYAFCRRLDDDVDDAPDPETARHTAMVWTRRVAELAAGRPDKDPVSQALAWAMSRFPIKAAHLALITEGTGWDLTRTRYATFGDLHDYCYRVATAVGLVVLAVTDPSGPTRPRYADLTGTAVQLTNILRDVGVDAAMGRIYLPREDLEAFSVTEDDILERRMTDGLGALLRFEGARARHLHDLAAASLSAADRRALFFPETLRDTYRLLLDRLVEEDFPVFEAPVRIGKPARIALALRHRVRSLLPFGARE